MIDDYLAAYIGLGSLRMAAKRPLWHSVIGKSEKDQDERQLLDRITQLEREGAPATSRFGRLALRHKASATGRLLLAALIQQHLSGKTFARNELLDLAAGSPLGIEEIHRLLSPGSDFCRRRIIQLEAMPAFRGPENGARLAPRLTRWVLQEPAPVAEPARTSAGFRARAKAPLKVHELRDLLAREVVGQSEAVTAIALAVARHAEQTWKAGPRPASARSHVLLFGPTGSGKTFLAQKAAEKAGLAFCVADATTLTETGYVGPSVSDLVEELCLKERRMGYRPGTGVLFVDEIDKVASASDNNRERDIAGRCVQEELLKVMDGKTMTVGSFFQRMRVDTSGILIVAAGAFSGLNATPRGRRAGFGVEQVPRARAKTPDHQDLIAYGLLPELVGRFAIRAPLAALGRLELAEILRKGPLLPDAAEFLLTHGIAYAPDEKDIERMAAEAETMGLGARGLRILVEREMAQNLSRQTEAPAAETKEAVL